MLSTFKESDIHLRLVFHLVSFFFYFSGASFFYNMAACTELGHFSLFWRKISWSLFLKCCREISWSLFLQTLHRFMVESSNWLSLQMSGHSDSGTRHMHGAPSLQYFYFINFMAVSYRKDETFARWFHFLSLSYTQDSGLNAHLFWKIHHSSKGQTKQEQQ